MSKLAFVTGAAGFIGRHVCRELDSQGWRVAAIGLGDFSLDEQHSWGVSIWRNEEISLESLQSLVRATGEPQILIHCAGGSSVAFSLTHPREDFKRTVTTMADVLEFARKREGQLAVVVPSSAAVYGQVPREPISEETPLHPVSPYGVHKRISEELCQSYAVNWKVPVAIVRLFSVYGEGLRKQLLWDACIKAKCNTFTFFGSGNEIRDWIHVTDVASLLILASEKASSSCPVVNGGSGMGLSVREVLCRLGEIWSPPLHPEFSGELRQGDPQYYVADVASMHAWGYRTKKDMKDALSEYIDWFLSEPLS